MHKSASWCPISSGRVRKSSGYLEKCWLPHSTSTTAKDHSTCRSARRSRNTRRSAPRSPCWNSARVASRCRMRAGCCAHPFWAARKWNGPNARYWTPSCADTACGIVSVASLRDDSGSCPQLSGLLRRFEKELAKLPREQLASEWGRDFARLLDALKWPGDRPLSSREHQVVEAWHGALSDLAALDIATPPMSFDKALDGLRQIAEATPFQVENEGAPHPDHGDFGSVWFTIRSPVGHGIAP